MGCSCSLCGTTVETEPGPERPHEQSADAPPLGWSMSVEKKRVTYQCPACAREHIRSIEAKLSEEYW